MQQKNSDITIALTEPQEQFVFSEFSFPAIVGGLGSGKSEAGILRLFILMIQNRAAGYPEIDCLIGFPTYDLCRLRGMSGIEEVAERLGFEYRTNKSEFYVELKGLGRILLRSYDRPERWVAFQVAHVVMDELDTLPPEKAALVWRKAAERVRQKSFIPNSIAVVTTPDQGINGFVYSKWVKHRQNGYVLYKASTYSNPYLPPDYIDQIKANYDPVLVDLYLNGEFVSLSRNKVYYCFDRKRHHTNRVLLDTDTVIYAGVDFNVGGCCVTIAVIDSGFPVFVDEFTAHDTYDITIKLAQRYRDKKVILHPDASGAKSTTNASQSDIAILSQAGYHVVAPPSNPPVRDRINAVNSLLAHDKLRINTDKCPNLALAFESQGYTDKGEPEKADKHPAFDDWVDSAGYFINSRWPVRKPIINPIIRM